MQSGCRWLSCRMAALVLAMLSLSSMASLPHPFLCLCPQEAEAALNSLDKASLGELKSFGSPAAEIVQVLAAVMVLASPGGNIPKVRFRTVLSCE